MWRPCVQTLDFLTARNLLQLEDKFVFESGSHVGQNFRRAEDFGYSFLNGFRHCEHSCLRTVHVARATVLRTMFKLLRASTGGGSSSGGHIITRCWLKASILHRDHENVSKAKDSRLDKEDSDDTGVIDSICKVMAIMLMPPITLDSPRQASVLLDNLYFQWDPGITMDNLRWAVKKRLTVEVDESMQCEEIELNLQEFEADVDKLGWGRRRRQSSKL